MGKDENDFRKKLKEMTKETLENQQKWNEELKKIKLKEAEEVAKEIIDAIPECNSRETFEKIVDIVTAYQTKKEEPLKKFLEMNNQRYIIELQNTNIDDPDWWAKASAAKALGIIIPGMKEFIDLPPKKKNG